MPNHVLGIIIINKPDGGHDVETQNFASLRKNNKTKNKFEPQSQNLASIIRGYKSGVKKHATMNDINFAWQSRFHDHIIRNDKSFNNIRYYIVENPAKWEHDKFYIVQ
jgi:putative transposase